MILLWSTGFRLNERTGMLSVKIDKADGRGELTAFGLTNGEASDCTHFET